VIIGPQVQPSYPGSDELSFRPLFGVDRARGDDPFPFEAADESFGFEVIGVGPLSFGPALGFEGKRDAEDVGAPVPEVDFSFEIGGFANLQLSDSFRLRAELRKGVSGHEGLIGTGGADFVMRDADHWLFAIGPRVTWSDDNYHDAYFSVAPATATATGLAPFDADAGVQAVGATASFVTQLTPRWGIYAYAKYDRLIEDAADSPLVLAFGSRDQFSGGAALTYTFGRNVPR
jgi:outer membrane scaffolding protein for murein synthesis (MipA/OmpV family)